MSAYKQLWKVVEGSVSDAFNRHPDYLTPKGRKSAPASIIKRVTGTVLSFAVQAAKSQRELAEKDDRALCPDHQVSGVHTSDAGAGALFRQPQVPAAVGMIRFKRRSRYRSPDIFNLKTHELRQFVALPRPSKGV